LFEQQNGQPEKPLDQDATESSKHKGQQNYIGAGGVCDEYDAPTEQTPSDPRHDNAETENVDIDPNSERKKRQKTTMLEDSESKFSQTTAEGPLEGRGSWLAQLQAAARSDYTKPQEQRALEADLRPSPITPQNASPVKLAIRKSPIKTPAKLQFIPDAPAATPPSAGRPTTRSSSSGSKRAPSPGLGPTPKKKVIKLTSKGKLLSSPPSVSPASKRKTRSKQTKPAGIFAPEPRRSTHLSYGEDDESRTQIGNQIDKILSQSANSASRNPARLPEPPKITHPFFLGKPAKKTQSEVMVLDDELVTGQDSDATEKPENGGAIKPKDWNDLGFKKNQTSTAKVVEVIRTLWPPKDMQHLGVAAVLPVVQHDCQTSLIRQKSSKSRMELFAVPVDQDVLQQFAATLDLHPGQLRDTFPLPQKMLPSRQKMIETVMSNLSSSPGQPPGLNTLQDTYPQAVERMRLKLLSDTSSNNIIVAGIVQSWLSNSAPQQINEVLQSGTAVLRKWLASHQVHHTATKLPGVQTTKAPRKRRRKKKTEDLDDFIATSDEDEETPTTAKNAILITGPSGCGKTASVYAAAKELDFEVFEIYPGMRRSAKDIFDKVGDMTQNHLVQKATQLDRARDSTPENAILGVPTGGDNEGSKSAFETFLGGKGPTAKKATNGQSRAGTPKDEVGVKPQSRKQSLILFEEVDILFEEDRGFWSGVIQLIEQSKRPAILTCNDPTAVPVEDLPLHTTLQYEAIPVNVGVDYLLLLAASEGHLLQREAVRLLYLSNQNDLRATIAGLSFWCQMAVGSEKAGLDWTVEPRPSGEAMKPEGEKLKLFSKNTYLPGMGLVPRTLIDADPTTHGALLQYAEDELGIPLQHWLEEGGVREQYEATARPRSDLSMLSTLQQQLDLSEMRSNLDLLSQPVDLHGGMGDRSERRSNFDLLSQPVDAHSETEHLRQAAISAEIAARTLSVFTPQAPSVSAVDIVRAHLQANAAIPELFSNSILTAFEPLMAEKPRFPPSLGRLAPSLETPSRYLIADIAPYVRSIVRYDKRLEVHRDAVAGELQGIKTRKTRASRAALEGGSKASTREEKWFPKRTNYAAVLQTGGKWHLWEDQVTRLSSDESSIGTGSRTVTTVASPAADVDMTDDA
jgi:hypothetical protein